MTMINASASELPVGAKPFEPWINGGWIVPPANVPGKGSVGFAGNNSGNRLKAEVTYCYPPGCGSNYFATLEIRVPPILENHCDVVAVETEASCWIEQTGSSPRGAATFTDTNEMPGRVPMPISGRVVNQTSSPLSLLGSTVAQGGSFVSAPHRLAPGQSFDFEARGGRGKPTFGGLAYKAPQGDRIEVSYALGREKFDHHGSADDGTNGVPSPRYAVQTRVAESASTSIIMRPRVTYVITRR
jgi:hypothetical protein